MVRPKKNFIKRYGEGSWVLVTGASDGIGKEFCLEFARQGFNIVIVGRNIEKCQQVKEEIFLQNSNIKTKIIIVDFS